MFTLNSGSPDFLDTLDLSLKIIGGIGAVILFFIGYRRYVKEQDWKRNEFVANEIKAFTSDDMVKNAMYILDWGTRYIQLFPDKPDYKDRYVKIDRQILENALQHHTFRAKEDGRERFTETEVAIRDTFDHFFAYFERFYQFIEAGLLSHKELEPYLNYWINTLAVDMEESTRNVIYHYVNSYGFKGTQQLFKQFGRDIFPKNNTMGTKI